MLRISSLPRLSGSAALRNSLSARPRAVVAAAFAHAHAHRSQRRNASTSFYNTDVAGLTEEQAEVRCPNSPAQYMGAWKLTVLDLLCVWHAQFRNAVEEFAEKEVAPRAAEIDRTNNFPPVRIHFVLRLSFSTIHRT